MKASVTKQAQTFQPITVNITMESENDVKWFVELFGMQKSLLVDVNDNFRALKDPDIDGALRDMLVITAGL